MALGGFVDSTTGNDGDSGQTLDLAWATMEHAVEAGGLGAGDVVIIRGIHTEIPTSDIAPVYDGGSNSPIVTGRLPRVAFEITSASWTNGNTTVDNVLPATIARNIHQARYIEGPDGEIYFITRVVDANTFVIDKEYVGTSVTLTDGASTIQADDFPEIQVEWDAYDDSADIIKKADWEADADTLPLIDFNGTAFHFQPSGDNYLHFYGIEFYNSIDASGVVYLRSLGFLMKNCLISNSNNERVVGARGCGAIIWACTIEGSGAGASQIGLYIQDSVSIFFKDVAIYNCGDHGIRTLVSNIGFNGLNVGVEIANGDDDIALLGGTDNFKGNDLKLGGSNGYVLNLFGRTEDSLHIENYQRVLSEHRTYKAFGYCERVAVSGETPNKKISDYVMKITPNVNLVQHVDFSYKIFRKKLYDLTASSHTVTVWIYNDTGVTLNDLLATDNIFIKAKYLSSYNDTSEYTYTEILSAQIDILDAADADAWIALTVTFTPATTGDVLLEGFANLYSAAGHLFVDGATVLS